MLGVQQEMFNTLGCSEVAEGGLGPAPSLSVYSSGSADP